MNGSERGRACGTYNEDQKQIQDIGRETEGNSPFGKPRRR